MSEEKNKGMTMQAIADFCGVTGKEKYSWSHVYLRRV